MSRNAEKAGLLRSSRRPDPAIRPAGFHRCPAFFIPAVSRLTGDYGPGPSFRKPPGPSRRDKTSPSRLRLLCLRLRFAAEGLRFRNFGDLSSNIQAPAVRTGRLHACIRRLLCPYPHSKIRRSCGREAPSEESLRLYPSA